MNNDVDQIELEQIANDLFADIKSDLLSRQKWISDHAKKIKRYGLWKKYRGAAADINERIERMKP
jgi:hypothetical protein